MENKTPDQQNDQDEKQEEASTGLSAYLAAEREEEAWLERMQVAAKAKKSAEENEKKPTSR